jgi:hypothetical protein
VIIVGVAVGMLVNLVAMLVLLLMLLVPGVLRGRSAWIRWNPLPRGGLCPLDCPPTAHCGVAEASCIALRRPL